MKNILATIVLIFGLISRAGADVGLSEVIQGLWKGVRVADASFIQRSLQKYYDFPAFYEAALIDHWMSWTEEERREFDQKFEKVFLRTLADEIKKIPTTGTALKTGLIQKEGDRMTLSLVGKGPDGEVPFRVFFIRRGADWKIYDVEVSGALLSRNYRAHFNKILRVEGISGLLARLDKATI